MVYYRDADWCRVLRWQSSSNGSLLRLYRLLEHIDHEQSAEPEAFAERIFDLHSCKPAVLVTVLVEQFPDLRALLKHLEFDAVYIRDDFLKHITTGRTTEAI